MCPLASSAFSAVLIEKNGVPVAALISPRKLDFLLMALKKREEAFQAIS